MKNTELVAVVRDIPKNELDIRVNFMYRHILEQHIGPVNSIVQDEVKKKLKNSFLASVSRNGID